MTDKVLFSTDIGSDIDDALALLAGINADIGIEGVYTINGDVTTRAFIARHLASLARKNLEIAVGSSEPITQGSARVTPYKFFEENFLDIGYFRENKETREVELIPLEEAGIKSDAHVRIAERLAREPHVLFCTAPLTDIARVLEKSPKVIPNIKQLYFMGCRFDGDLEHNVRHDIDAAKMVFDSDIPVTIIPGELCSRLKLPVNQLDNLEQTEAGRYVQLMAKGFVGAKTAVNLNFQGLESIGSPYYIIRERVTPTPKLHGETSLEIERLLTLKNRILANLIDPSFAALQPEEYFQQHQELINHLQDPRMNFRFKYLAIEELKKAIPESISVADVYVPYCYLNPKGIKMKQGNVSINSDGTCGLARGNKHRVITDIDFSDFQKFLAENLR